MYPSALGINFQIIMHAFYLYWLYGIPVWCYSEKKRWYGLKPTHESYCPIPCHFQPWEESDKEKDRKRGERRRHGEGEGRGEERMEEEGRE